MCLSKVQRSSPSYQARFQMQDNKILLNCPSSTATMFIAEGDALWKGNYCNIVKPVLRGHLWDKEKVAL